MFQLLKSKIYLLLSQICDAIIYCIIFLYDYAIQRIKIFPKICNLEKTQIFSKKSYINVKVTLRENEKC